MMSLSRNALVQAAGVCVCLLAVVPRFMGFAEESGEEHREGRQPRVELEIKFDQRAGKSTPVRVNLDFDTLLPRGVSGLIDPHTIVVKRRLRCRTRTYNARFAENLYYKNQGWVAWLVDEPRKGGNWTIGFGMRAADGRMAEPPFQSPVGVGDKLCHNGFRWQPIGVPGYLPHPISVDWNADGLVDVISKSGGTNNVGMPMAGVFFWRNIGTNEQPRFDVPLRLSADGVDQQHTLDNYMVNFRPRRDFMSEDYMACDVFDWFGSGRMDLITLSRPGGIKVYRNTGRLDAVGLPILELAQRPEYPSCIAKGRYPGLRVVDWDGSGRPTLVIGTMYRGEREGLGILRQIAVMRTVGGEKGDWKFESVPLGRDIGPKKMPLDWRKYSNFEGERPFYFDWFDSDGDGKLEMFCSLRWNDKPQMEMWRNVGSLEQPVMRKEGAVPWFSHNTGFFMRFTHDKAFKGCLIGSSEGMRYLEQLKPDVFAIDAFADRGLLLGQGCELKLQGYVRPVPFDADGNGTMDLFCGDEPGFMTLTKNLGTTRKPVFAPPVKMKDIHRKEFQLCDTNLYPMARARSWIGQLKPFLCDWDQDGQLDIIVSGGTFDLIYWLENYDPATNQFEKMHALGVRGGNADRPFKIRKGPVVVDWDKDGRPELVAVGPSDAICLFHQGKKGSANALTMLEPGIPLRYEDGKEITTRDFLPYGNITLWPCDWTGSDACDLIVAGNHYNWLLENVGSDARPVFRKPRKFMDPDGNPISVTHHEGHGAGYDWDADGRLDLMVGGESGAIYLFHRDWLSGIKHKVTVRR